MSLIDITVSTFHYQLVLVYASSDCSLQHLALDLEGLLHKTMTCIVVGDFNFDKKETNALIRFFLEKKFEQKVYWPTQKEGRTIDHCYISANARVQVTGDSPYFSDHDSLCIKFEHFPWT